MRPEVPHREVLLKQVGRRKKSTSEDRGRYVGNAGHN